LRIMIQSFYAGFWSSSVCEKNPHRYKWLNMFDLWYLRLIIPSQRHCFFNIQINIFFTKSKIRISNDRFFKKKVDFKYTGAIFTAGVFRFIHIHIRIGTVLDPALIGKFQFVIDWTSGL
jgi:hypothetical protein